MKFVSPHALAGILSFAMVIHPISASSLRGDAPPEEGPRRSLLESIEVPEGMSLETPVVHLVSLGQQCSEGEFRALIEDLEGKVTFYHEGTSIAVVQGLSEGSLATAEASDCVESIDLSENIPMNDPFVIETDQSNTDEVVGNPDDPTAAYFHSFQWNMRAIEAEKAWEAGRLGSKDVTVAILDTGIGYEHADLVGRVDLSRSASFCPFDDLLASIFFSGKDSITDLDFHGTHVAATVASNAKVAAGVTSKTTLIGVKVCCLTVNEDGNIVPGGCPFGSIIAGLLHAVDAGADIANLSLGGSFPKNEAAPGYFNKVFNYANSKKMAVVVAAGNEASDLDKNGNAYQSFCDTPNTMCVSATGPTSSEDLYVGPFDEVDAPAFYSNYGTSAINVAAPGGNVGGYVWAACSPTSLFIDCRSGRSVIGLGGTSMASPHVAGLAALVVEDNGRNPGRVRSIIANAADDLGKKGTDPYYGKGRINVANTVL